MLEAQRDGFLETLYAAPTSPALWSGVLDQCMELVGADSGWVNTLDRRDRLAGDGLVNGIETSEQDRYFEYYAKLDPFRIDGAGAPSALDMWSDEYFLPKSELVHTEFYADFLRPINVHSILIAKLYDDGNITRAMHLNFDGRRDWSAASGWRDLKGLFAHLKRAAALSQEVKRLKLGTAALGDALDASAGAAFLLDGRGRIGFATEAGEALLRRGDCLEIEHGRVRAACPSACAELDSLIAAATDPARRFRIGGVLDMPVASRGLPMIVMLTPLQTASRQTGEPVAMMTVRDPTHAGLPAVQTLAQRFGLTATESKVALALAAGASPREIAAAQAITYNTVRNHLKQVYSKLGVNRQGELVAAILRMDVRASGRPAQGPG